MQRLQPAFWIRIMAELLIWYLMKMAMQPMEQGGGNLTGTYEYVDEYTLLVSLDNSGSTLNYACAFAEDEDGVTMVLMNDDTGYNGIYFMQ